MNTLAKNTINLKCIRGGKKTFSEENLVLIKKAYPWLKGVSLTNLCKTIDKYVRLKRGNDVSAKEHLKGRVYGLSGVAV